MDGSFEVRGSGEGLEGDWREVEGGAGSEGGGGRMVGAGALSGGALGLGLVGWSHKYCCTSSAIGSIVIDDSRLRNTVDMFIYTG